MRAFWRCAVVLVVAAVGVATAWPQEPAFPTGTTAKLLLLRQKSVQKELDIPADMAKKIMDFTNEQAEAADKAIGMAKGERKKAFAQLEKQNKKFLADTLNEKQSTRLNQLYLQATAPYQLTREKTAKALNLTDEQQQKFKDLDKEYRKEMGDILFGKDTEGRAEKFAKLRAKTATKIKSILTKKQQEQAREAVGPSFMGKLVFEDDSPKKK